MPVGVETPPATGLPCLTHDVVIRDNVVVNAIGAGIFYGPHLGLQPNPSAFSASILKNEFTNGSRSGVRCAANTYAPTLASNTFTANGRPDIDGYY